MRTVLVILDGLADEPIPALGSRTPLHAAHTPHLDRLAGAGRVGRLAPIPSGLRAGSEVGVPVCLGLDPAFGPRAGRAALEALGRGLTVAPGEVVLRATCVRLSGPFGAPGTRVVAVADPAATYDAVRAVAGGRLIADPGGRHLAVLPGPPEPETVPPHDLVGLPLALGGVPAHPDLWAELAQRLPGDLALWPWGGPVAGPSRDGTRGPFGAVVTGTDLVRGIARAAGMDAPYVPGATGGADSDFAAKARAALALLAHQAQVAVHVEAPDMAAHRRDPAAKAAVLERIDRDLIGQLAESHGDVRLVVTGDHGTSSVTGRHLDGPVPFVAGIASTARPGGRRTAFHEAAVGDAPVLDATAWRRLLRAEARVPC